MLKSNTSTTIFNNTINNNNHIHKNSLSIVSTISFVYYYSWLFVCFIFTNNNNNVYAQILSSPPSSSSLSTIIIQQQPNSNNNKDSTINYTPEQLKEMKDKARCFKQRFLTNDQVNVYKTELNRCDGMLSDEDFCRHIKCDLPSHTQHCSPGQTLVPNQVGHRCCPACVTFLPDGARCTPATVLEQCANGLYCDPSKQICQLPLETKACLIDYHNRMSFRARSSRDPPTGFWIPAEIGPMELLLQYAKDMELPACTPGVGNYEIKQRFRNK